MKRKILFLSIPVVIVIALLAAGTLWKLTSKQSLDNSQYFDRGFVENAVIETVGLINQEDYGTLSAIAAESAKEELDAGHISSMRTKISGDWGSCTGYGVIYTYEIVKNHEHYAQGTVEATYENVTVDYCFLYDVDMRLVEITME